jgi:hypothetical protein
MRILFVAADKMEYVEWASRPAMPAFLRAFVTPGSGL